MTDYLIDISKYRNALSRKNQLARFVWSAVWAIFARPVPRSLLSGWKRFLLRCFGAKIHRTSVVYSSARIYMPWNLEMDEYSCLSPEVDCYNVDKVKIGAHAVVSQKCYLCTASHDVSSRLHPLITAPIVVKDQAWLGASAYIGMGVEVGQGAVVGATASVYKDVEAWTIVGGNPAKFIKKREIKE
jgi:putative colanic acid biosynthesis acetyltransferase WcaF